MTDSVPSSSGWSRTAWWIFVLAVVLVLFILFFDALSTVVLGLLAAAIVACALNPLLRFIPGPRGLAAAVVGLGLIATVAGLLLALSWPLAAPIENEIRQWPQTSREVDQFLRKWSTEIGLEQPLTVQQMISGIGKFFAGTGGQEIFSRSADVGLRILIWLVFIFIGSIFLLADPGERLLGPALRMVPPHRRGDFRLMLERLGVKYRRWVGGTLLSMCIVFTASAIGYAVIGLNLALPLALLGGLCEVVPTVGPATACVIASLVAAATNGGGALLGVLAVYGVIQSLEAYLILPMIMRGAVAIHPAVTLFTVVLWGKIFGVPGLMLAIPINLTLWTLLDVLYLRPREGKSVPALELTADSP